MKIRVNSVHPGVIDTDMGDAVVSGISGLSGMGGNETRERISAQHPLGHFGKPTNIADAIVFLSLDKAEFVTGSEMVVDGGWTAQ